MALQTKQDEIGESLAAREDLDWEEDFKEVYWPDFDSAPAETTDAGKLWFAFISAGYAKLKIKEAPTHPVWVVRAIRATARRIPEYQQFRRHIWELLRGAGFCLRKDELTVDQTGDRILVAIPSCKPAASTEEILRESEEDFVDHQDMPL